jgi:hypothetical protein
MSVFQKSIVSTAASTGSSLNSGILTLIKGVLLLMIVSSCGSQLFAQKPDGPLSTANQVITAKDRGNVGKRITFNDGRTLIVDEAWRRGTEVWVTHGGFTQSLEGVKSIEPLSGAEPDAKVTSTQRPKLDSQLPEPTSKAIWIYLLGGASFKVDDVSNTSTGIWYRRGSVSEFVANERIERIDRSDGASPNSGRKSFEWTSGNSRIDQLIRINGERYGVDPYLVFCVIEHESHFKVRAVSPKGARGLMQLMPATARRFGVRRPFDPADNIGGGTQYLKKLMGMFGRQIPLVLASYNAGEGAVMKYGRSVPPYRETREYVKRIGKRYGI